MPEPVRVLVVDDSAFMRRVVTDLLESDEGVRVVGTARDGLDTLDKVADLQPDVITLDVEMPRLDGLETLRRIMADNPRPVVMVSSLTQTGADATMRALRLGAVDFVPKPSGAVSLDLHRVRDELVHKVKAAARVQMIRVKPAALAPSPRLERSVHFSPHITSPGSRQLGRLVLVAASTGGPGALYRMLGPLPNTLRAGMLVVQHMPAGFTRSLADHLDEASGLVVREAAPGDRLVDGLALLAAGGRHLVLTPDGAVDLVDGPPRNGVRPAADVTFESIPDSVASRCLVVILTGMGMDGARGAWYLKAKGATVWAQDEGSSVVYGMPRAVAELGVVDRVGTPEQLAGWIAERIGT